MFSFSPPLVTGVAYLSTLALRSKVLRCQNRGLTTQIPTAPLLLNYLPPQTPLPHPDLLMSWRHSLRCFSPRTTNPLQHDAPSLSSPLLSFPVHFSILYSFIFHSLLNNTLGTRGGEPRWWLRCRAAALSQRGPSLINPRGPHAAVSFP